MHARLADMRFLRRRLVLVFLTLLVGVGFAARIYYLRYEQAHREDIWRRLDDVAKLKAEQIEAWRRERLSDARFLATADFVARDIERLVAEPDSPAARAAVEDWLRLIKGGDRYRTVYVLDRALQTVLLLGEHIEGIGGPLRQSAERVLASGRMELTDFHRAADGRHIHLDVLVPIRGCAVVVLQIDPELFLYPLVENWPLPSASGKMLLVTREGGEALLLNPPNRASTTSFDARFPLERVSDATGVRETLGHRGQPVVAAVQPIAESDWWLLAEIDHDEAYADLRESAWMITGFAGAMVAAIGAAVVFLWRTRRSMLDRERWQAERKAGQLEARLAALMRQSHDVIVVYDEQGRVVEASEGARQTYGYAESEIERLPAGALAADGVEGLQREMPRLATEGTVRVRHCTKDGRRLWMEGRGRAIETDGRRMLVAVYRDVTERMRAEIALARSNRFYAAMVRINEVAPGIGEAKGLGEAICRALVDVAGVQLAWIGWMDPATRRIEIETVFGPAVGYAEGIELDALPGSPQSRGLSGRAVLQQEVVWSEDFEREEWMAPWREEARQHGLRSGVGVPLVDPVRRRLGVLTLFSNAENFFDPQVVPLLRQLAVDFSLELQVMAARRELQVKNAALEEGERRFRRLFYVNPMPMWLHDERTLSFLAVNEAAVRQYGYSEAEFLAMTLRDIRPAWEMDRFIGQAREQEADAGFGPGIWLHRRKSGEMMQVEVSAHAFEFDGRAARLVLAQDVTERERAAAALRDSEELNRVTFERAGVGVAHVALDGRWLRVNPRLCEMVGYEEKELLQTDFRAITHPEDVQLGDAEAELLLSRQREAYSLEKRYLHKDGHVVHVGVTVSLVRDSGGQPLHYISVVEDRTGQRQAEQSRRESEERLELAVQASRQGIFDLDVQSGAVSVSPEYATMLGYTPEEFHETHAAWIERLHPDDVQGTVQAIRDYLDGRRADYQVEFRQRRKDGSWCWTLSIGRVVERDEAGRSLRLIGTHTDITPLKTAELALYSSEVKFRLLFESNLHGMLIATLAGEIREANEAACQLLGWSEQELCARSLESLFDDTDGRVAVVLSEGARMGRVRGELRMLRRDGGLFEAEVASRRFETPAGSKVSYVVHDISQRKRMESDLRFQAKLANTMLELPPLAEKLGEREFLQAALERAENLTGSRTSFIHYVHDGPALELVVCSRRTGQAEEQALEDPSGIAELAGPWGDALRGKRGVRANDGISSGAWPAAAGSLGWLERVAVVPVLAGDVVVMLVGVGNKAGDYVEQDLTTVQLIANLAWRVVQQHRTRRETEDAMASLRAIFAASPVGMISYDESGQAEAANEAAARITGGTIAGLTAQNFWEIRSWRESGMEAAADRALTNYEPVAIETRFVTTFGKDVWVAAQFVPYRRGDRWRLLLLLTDISERMRATAVARLQTAALDAAANAIAITDARGKIEWVNEAFVRQTGYSLGEILGCNPRFLKSGHHPEEFYAEMWKTISAGVVWHGEIRNRRKDGTEVDEDTTITPLRDERGQITHYIAIKQDVTERKRLEHLLLRSQRMESIGLLAGGIAHDLNNILSPILMSVEILRRSNLEARAARSLAAIDAAAKRGAGVVKQVLTFARGIEGERAPLRLRDVTREMATILEETFPRQIEIHREPGREPELVRGDGSQLHQVLLNLSVNARDAMPEGGTLTLRTGVEDIDPENRPGTWGELKAGRHVMMAVRDTGPGITPEVLDHMFEPFFTTKAQGKGTGLGLATVLGIVRSHHGFIEVESKVGEGTEFRVYLPVAEDQSPGMLQQFAGDPVDGHGLTVLLCDDEESIRGVTGEVLIECGFRVITAVNGVEAVNRFREESRAISVLITDIMMPKMNGDVAAELMLRDRPDLPVIFMSGLSEEATVAAAVAKVPATLRHLLHKPFKAEELNAALRAVGIGAKRG